MFFLNIKMNFWLFEINLKMNSFNIRILGAYGTQGEKEKSSSFFIDEKNLIDGGTILKPLKENSALIETIWLTHSHLDHISDIAYTIDNFYEKREKTLVLKGLPQTLKSIKKHIFNNEIWPDFSKIHLSNGKDYSLTYESLELYKKYNLDNKTTIEPFPTDHTVASCGYIIKKENSSLLISSDTYSLKNIIEIVEKNKTIKTILIECSFPSKFNQLAKISKHLTPKLLFEFLKPIKNRNLKLYINHLKPLYKEEIKKEIEELKENWNVTVLEDNEIIYF